jgi:hypothetical protein
LEYIKINSKFKSFFDFSLPFDLERLRGLLKRLSIILYAVKNGLKRRPVIGIPLKAVLHKVNKKRVALIRHLQRMLLVIPHRPNNMADLQPTVRHLPAQQLPDDHSEGVDV